MENVLKVPAAMQQAKAYLYGSLLYYLTMTRQEDSGPERGGWVDLRQGVMSRKGVLIIKGVIA